MSLRVHSNSQGDETILELDGMITLGAGSLKLREELRSALSGAADTVILDCAAVELVDSSGLAEIMSAHVHAEKLGRRLVLRNPGWRLLTVLNATRLNTVLHIEALPQPQAAPLQ